MFDVVVIGAGIAGLTAAQQLHQAGYRVLVVEKSRGVGGRMATRRLQGTRADHGVRYLEPQGERLQQLIQTLQERHILQVWTDTIYKFDAGYLLSDPPSAMPRYTALEGMSAIAKFLASGLEIWLERRVQKITPTGDRNWHLTFDRTDEPSREVTAGAVVVAIPAPQALMLLEPSGENFLPAAFLESLRSVQFDPCISVMAGYGANQQLDIPWKAVELSLESDLAWIGLDSSKRRDASSPLFVIQSSAKFAQNYLESEELNSAGRHLLERAAIELMIPWLNSPEWFQVHRWRYAFPRHFLPQPYLETTTPLPLICCGDWCGGNLIESALDSGLAAAIWLDRHLDRLPLPGINFLGNL